MAKDFDIDIDYGAVDSLLFAPGRGIVTRVTERFAARVARRAVALAPARTGRLKSSIRATDAHRSGANKAEAEVVADAPYAAFVHEGTGPHVIRPRNGKALRFNNNGQLIFSRKVNHPGTKANRFLTTALDLESARDIVL